MDWNKTYKGKEPEGMVHKKDGSQDIAQAMPGDMSADNIAVEDAVASGQGKNTEDTVMPGQKKAIDDTAASTQGKAVNDIEASGQEKTSDDIMESNQEQAVADTGTSEQEQKVSEKESDQGYGKGDELLNRYRENRKNVESDTGEDSVSQIELLRQELENWGMKFAGSTIQNSTFVVNNVGHKEYQGEDAKKNLLGEAAEGEMLDWCSQHYQDLHFSMLLAVCILDRQPYQTIYQMARELQKIFAAGTEKQDEEKSGKTFKSQISETLGIIGYSDFTSVRGVMTETDFLRLPVHEQAERYIQLMVKEFPELKFTLSDYLVNKIIAVYDSRHNYNVISGCMEALVFIAATDLQFFNGRVVTRFLRKKATEMDFCLSVLLGKLYHRRGCRDFVKACVVQWGQLKNNPHCSLTALYVCSMLGKQESLVRDIWIRILDRLIEEFTEEFTEESITGKLYFDILPELFCSGNLDISYYKGVIHAFYIQIVAAEKKQERVRWEFLNLIFLLFIEEDYDNCDLSEGKPNKRDMVWIKIFKKLDRQTGEELTELWYLVLDNRMYPREIWELLEAYLAEYQDYGTDDIEKLAFFFYHINQRMGRNRGLFFLKECSERSLHPNPMAKQIYNRIKG